MPESLPSNEQPPNQADRRQRRVIAAGGIERFRPGVPEPDR